MNGVNTNLGKDDTLTTLVSSENFLSLDSDLQNKIINTIADEKVKKGGFMGRFLGTEPTNVSMHIALLLCGILIVLLAIDFFHAYRTEQQINMDLVNTIIPVVTLSLGYIFGRGSK